jgi:uncharacterized lipoprotein
MIRKYILTAAGLAALATVSGCGSSGVFDRERPDEFAVSRAAPLEVPSEFNLPAPQKNAARPQESDAKEKVLDAIFGTPAQPKQ